MIVRVPLLSAVLVFMAVCLVLTAKQDVQVAHLLTGYHPLSRLGILQQGPSRMMASKAMTTYVVYRTTIPTCSFTTSCAVTNGPVSACRRRELDIDAILPNKPIKVETTSAPEESASSFIPDIVSSSEPRDVLVNGLLPGGTCGPSAGPSFGVTIIYTRTIISDFICLASVTHTNTFTVAGCTPLGLVYCNQFF
ncbi:uncharacterized protein LOC130697841 [Daphnia carinata]|uniref:uncharacterized protein LOC130697841 n=1 Tax=Daphnia carinata TaxID=120202 RepID=UPI00257C1F78|nr:uncharacterized protein LOC130697841 [Daphnia carinata]